jgi:MFS family permease
MSEENSTKSEQLRRKAFEIAVEEHHSHNFVMMVAEGSLFIAAMVLYSGTTVLSGLMTRLGAGATLIGLTVGGWSFVWTGVQIYAAYRQGHLPMKRRPIVLLRFLAGCVWTGYALVLFFLYEETPAWRTAAIWALVGTVAVFALLGGYSVPLWMDFVGKIFRRDARGRYYGWRNGLGAAIGLGVSIFVLTPLLRTLTFPYGYAWALLLAGLLVSAGALCVGFSREAPSPERREPVGIREFVSGLFQTWRLSYSFRFFIVAVILTSFGGLGMGGCLATPFLMRRAIDRMGATDTYVGVATAVLVAGQVMAGLFCGRLVDRVSARLVFFLNMIASVFGLLLAVLMPDEWLWPFLAVFLMTGAARGMTSTSYHPCIMEMVPESMRPQCLGLANFIRSPTFILAPYMGGLVLSGSGENGFTVLFLVGLIFAVVNLVVFLAGVGIGRRTLPEDPGENAAAGIQPGPAARPRR